MTPWRTIDGEPQKRCPTCAARGREEWHAYPAFALDARRKNGLTIRCRECKAEDFQEAYATAVARNIQRDRDNPPFDGQKQRALLRPRRKRPELVLTRAAGTASYGGMIPRIEG